MTLAHLFCGQFAIAWCWALWTGARWSSAYLRWLEDTEAAALAREVQAEVMIERTRLSA